LENLLFFPNLESLYLYEPSYEEMMTMLEVYGSRLKNLYILGADDFTLELFRIFELCPHLETFASWGAELKSSALLAKVLPVENMKSLLNIG